MQVITKNNALSNVGMDKDGTLYFKTRSGEHKTTSIPNFYNKSGDCPTYKPQILFLDYDEDKNLLKAAGIGENMPRFSEDAYNVFSVVVKL